MLLSQIHGSYHTRHYMAKLAENTKSFLNDRAYVRESKMFFISILYFVSLLANIQKIYIASISSATQVKFQTSYFSIRK